MVRESVCAARTASRVAPVASRFFDGWYLFSVTVAPVGAARVSSFSASRPAAGAGRAASALSALSAGASARFRGDSSARAGGSASSTALRAFAAASTVDAGGADDGGAGWGFPESISAPDAPAPLGYAKEDAAGLSAACSPARSLPALGAETAERPSAGAADFASRFADGWYLFRTTEDAAAAAAGGGGEAPGAALSSFAALPGYGRSVAGERHREAVAARSFFSASAIASNSPVTTLVSSRLVGLPAPSAAAPASRRRSAAARSAALGARSSEESECVFGSGGELFSGLLFPPPNRVESSSTEGFLASSSTLAAVSLLTIMPPRRSIATKRPSASLRRR